MKSYRKPLKKYTNYPSPAPKKNLWVTYAYIHTDTIIDNVVNRNRAIEGRSNVYNASYWWERDNVNNGLYWLRPFSAGCHLYFAIINQYILQFFPGYVGEYNRKSVSVSYFVYDWDEPYLFYSMD